MNDDPVVVLGKNKGLDLEHNSMIEYQKCQESINPMDKINDTHTEYPCQLQQHVKRLDKAFKDDETSQKQL